MVEGYARERTRRTKDLIYLAWHVEAFHRQRRLPDLAELMKDTKPAEPQTDDAMCSVLRMFNAALGGAEVAEV